MVSRQDQIYYERELKYLIDEGKLFAERFPEIARYLNLQGTEPGSRDPHAERIVEGFAFLAGKLNRYLDAQFPELIQPLFHMLYPHYLQPLPSKTLVRFSAMESMVDKPLPIPRGTELYADGLAPDGSAYTFTTCWDVLLQPLVIEKVYVDPEAPGDYSLSASLQMHAGASSKNCRWDALEFGIHADPSTGQNLFLQLAESLMGIAVKGMKGGSFRLVWSGFGSDHNLGGKGSGNFSRLNYLRDYFDVPRRFLFFRIEGLDSFLKDKDEVTGLQLDFRFKRPFATGIEIKDDNLILYGAVAQNLYIKDCEPFKVDDRGLEYEVTPDSERDDVEVHDIERVLAAREREIEPVRPYFRFERGDLDRERQWFYMFRRDTALDRGWNCYLRFLDLKHQGPSPLAGNTVSIRARCTNRHYAQNLKLGQLDRISTEIPEIVRVVNLTQASPALWPPLHGVEGWDFLAHLCLDHARLDDPAAIKTLLGLYHYGNTESGRRKIKGLLDAQLHKDYMIHKGCCIQGQRLEIKVDGSYFSSSGDVALFSKVFSTFLDAYCPINGFIKLVVTETETGEVFRHITRG